MASMIDDYLHQVWAQLPPSMGKEKRTRILCEVEDHLRASWEAGCEQDLSEEESLRLTLERFGSPLTLGWELAQLDAQRQGRIVRSCFFVGLIAFLLLVLSSLFQYPEVSGTPIMLAIHCLLCGGIVSLYAGIALHGTKFAAPVEATGPWLGMRASLIFGLLLIGTSLASTLLISILWRIGGSPTWQQSLIGLTQTINAFAIGTPLLAWLGLTAWLSSSAAYETGSGNIGMKIGFWSGLMTGLVLALTGLLMYYIFLNVSLQTIWPHDLTCRGAHDLAACEMNDLLGGIATMILLLPLIGSILGAFSGFITRQAQQTVQGSSPH